MVWRWQSLFYEREAVVEKPKKLLHDTFKEFSQIQKSHIADLEDRIDSVYNEMKNDLDQVNASLDSRLKSLKSRYREEAQEKRQYNRLFVLVKKDLERQKQWTGNELFKAAEKNRIAFRQLAKAVTLLKNGVKRQFSKLHGNQSVDCHRLEKRLTKAIKLEVKNLFLSRNRNITHMQNCFSEKVESIIEKKDRELRELREVLLQDREELQSELKEIKSKLAHLSTKAR